MDFAWLRFRALANRVKESRTRESVPEHEGPLFISDLYGDIRHIAGPIVDSLIESDQRAGGRLLDATLYASPLLRGLVTLIEDFDHCAALSDVDPDIAALLRQASEAVFEGVKACIYAPGPRIMDQSRFLMEVEFLLRDLTARPGSLEEWRTADGFRRNQLFGFGQLRSRRERDLGIEAGHVLPDRDEYSVHSALVHPRPARELSTPNETPDARRFDLLSDLVDLFQHAVRVADAAVPAIEQFRNGVDDSDSDEDATGGIGDPVIRAFEFIANWQASWSMPTPHRPASVPVKPAPEANAQ